MESGSNLVNSILRIIGNHLGLRISYENDGESGLFTR